jgi:uncharacterized protein YciI
LIFTVIGLLKDPIEPQGDGFQAALNEHLAQRFPRVISAGYLRDAGGKVVGVLALLNADTIQQAEVFLNESPMAKADLYERNLVAQYDIEVGRLS